ncbi:EmrB/QacA subfamily drug resistance transporter [Croceifilum oryzae]|uniref:EmrB/QacA subfamily drug resistance transporter n=1 Tax=Croceifilum oryzae TaxID=1553429 RepID=A0AAJ1WTF4_9BACL|nr:DHA2 family efflux MFS transporter permease subunit [Croceifilum oryzae]MDQ0416936.1 EmrB/QacA subfamily drug resistance transporter [Croceifilum oryzae]
MKRTNKLVLLAMALGILMASLDNTITSAAINAVIEDIGGFDRVSWVFTAYVLASTSTMLVFGKMSDIFGRKLLYLIGIGLFLTGSILCGFSQNIDQLIWSRVLQGIGAGSLMPISFTIIFSLFSDPKEASKLTGVFAGIFGLSSVAGPQLGTWISSSLDWRWCFFVNVPVGILAFVILLFALQESRSQVRPKIDYFGTVFIIITTVSFMLGVEWGGKEYAWGSWQIIGLFALSVIFGIAFIMTEKRASEPILPLHLFKNKVVRGTSLMCLCQGAILFAAITYLPIFAVAVLGKTNSNSLLTPMMFSLMVGASVAGILQSKVSFRTLSTISMVSAIGISIALTMLSHTASWTTVTILMIILGAFALGPLMSTAQNAIAANVEPRYLGITSSIIGFWRNIGGVLGASIMATIVNNQLQHKIQDGATKLGIPADKVDQLANPEILMHSGGQVPPQIQQFLRDALELAINNGFYLAVIFSIVGLVAAISVGKGNFVEARFKKQNEAVMATATTNKDE